MKHDEVLDEATRAVERLLVQYSDYLAVSKKIESLKNDQMVTAVRLAEAAGSSFFAVLQAQPEEITNIVSRINHAENELSQISDEMTFDSPIAWMMYKYRAYAGTNGAIVDMEDFRKHCRPEGYICTKRYHFMRRDLYGRTGYDLDDISIYPDNCELNEIYTRKEILDLARDDNFMSQWRHHEYFTRERQVAKWQNYTPTRSKKGLD